MHIFDFAYKNQLDGKTENLKEILKHHKNVFTLEGL